MDIKLTFEAAKLPFYFVSLKGGRKTLEVQAFDGGLTVSVQYDFDRRPLSLNGEIKEGDRVEIVVSPTMSYYVKILSVTKGEDNEDLPISSY